MSPGQPARQATRGKKLLRSLALSALVGLLCGAGSALFLWLLELVTTLRAQHPQLVYALPVAGLAIGWLYQRLGEPIKAGNNLVIDTMRDAGAQIPVRMAPMVLVGTVLTHLFGGSAGREGTAVQMGASCADFVAHRFASAAPLRRQLLAAGVAGGFGSVFGTPLAGAVFAVEVATPGRLEYRALMPALVAALVGDLTTGAFGISHTVYPRPTALALSPLLFGKWCLFAAGIALCAVTFIELLHGLKGQAQRYLPSLPLRMLVGGLCIVLMWRAVGTDDYLGLGVPMIVSSFQDPQLPEYAFAAKLLFTVLTLGAGFLGGEVTPLFLIGASLGNVLARLLQLPLAMGAGVGMAAMFAVASRTPLALTVMAVELLGGQVLPHVLIVGVLGHLLAGRRSIYPAQLKARE